MSNEFEEAVKRAASNLIDKKEIAIDGDVYIYTGAPTASKLPKPKREKEKEKKKPHKEPKPPEPPKEPEPEIKLDVPETISPDTVLTKDMITIIVNDGNLINLGVFLGYSPSEAEDIIYNKTTYISKRLPPNVGARVDIHNNVEINSNVFNYILKYYDSPEKPERYWVGIHNISHEMVHVFTNCVIAGEIAEPLAEAMVPIIHYEFYANYNGALSPHMIDTSETDFERMMQKRAVNANRVPYPPRTFYFFDQLTGFNFLDHNLFMQTLRNYSHAARPAEEKLKAIRKIFPLEVD